MAHKVYYPFPGMVLAFVLIESTEYEHVRAV